MNRHPSALALAATLAFTAPAGAAIFRPTTTDDLETGSCGRVCSLRDAILAANASPGDDVVLLEAGSYLLTRSGAGEDSGASGDLDVAEPLFLIGAGAATTIIDATGLDRVLHVLPGVAVVVENVTLRGGNEPGDGGGALFAELASELTLRRVQLADSTTAGDGGGLLSRAAVLTVEASTLTGNEAAGDGGGMALANSDTVPAELVNLTFSGNLAGDRGGALHAVPNAGAHLRNATVTGNHAATVGGGIYSDSVPFLSIESIEPADSILAGNSAPKDPDCGGSPASAGENVVGVAGDCIDLKEANGDLVGTASAPIEPRLGPLAANGGPTLTHALLAGSPAIDRSAGCPELDQRGAERAAGGPACDTGAFEIADVCVAGGDTLCLLDGRFRVTVEWQAANGTGGTGTATPISGGSGGFSFFGPDNLEVVVKMLDACASANPRYWVFVSGLTNLGVTVRVEDVENDVVKVYRNPVGKRFIPRFDTRAFATCG